MVKNIAEFLFILALVAGVFGLHKYIGHHNHEPKAGWDHAAVAGVTVDVAKPNE